MSLLMPGKESVSASAGPSPGAEIVKGLAELQALQRQEGRLRLITVLGILAAIFFIGALTVRAIIIMDTEKIGLALQDRLGDPYFIQSQVNQVRDAWLEIQPEVVSSVEEKFHTHFPKLHETAENEFYDLADSLTRRVENQFNSELASLERDIRKMIAEELPELTDERAQKILDNMITLIDEVSQDVLNEHLKTHVDYIIEIHKTLDQFGATDELPEDEAVLLKELNDVFFQLLEKKLYRMIDSDTVAPE